MRETAHRGGRSIPWDAERRTALLATTPLFGGLPAPALKDAGEAFLPRRVRRGEFVFRAGEPATCLNLLAEGRVKVVREDEGGHEVIVRLIRPGEVFGGAGAWEEATYPASALAQADAVVLQLPVAAFRARVGAHPALALAIIRILAGRLREAEARIEQLQTERVEQRIARAVLRLAGKTGVRTAGGIRLGVPLSRQDLAELAGTTLSTASRTLAAWGREGIVDVGRQRVTIRQPHRLAALAGDLAPGDPLHPPV